MSDGAPPGVDEFAVVKSANEIPPASVPQRPIEDLLKDASEALAAANKAQEKGDPAEARLQYTLMLELLIEADLDPEVFYAMREPLGNIVDTSVRQASLYPREGVDTPKVDGIVYVETDGIPIPSPLPYRVIREIEQIKTVYPDAFQRGLDRSSQYLPYIQAEFEKAGLPKDLAWLAIVESNFWPTAVSRASAGGMWQFMKGTALQYKLRVDGHADAWVDERFDWQSATQAAIEYLKFLNTTFEGDWALAVTAYNIGEGALERAIAANGGDRNLWALLETPPASNQIHLEGKQYYARFLASIIVAKNPEAYGFTRNPLPAEDTVKVPVKGMYGLSDLDKELGYTPGTLAELNPDLLKGVTPPEHTGTYELSVPADDHRRFQTALRKVEPMKYGNLTHKVARGETFSSIAGRYGVSWRELMRLNGYTSDRSLRVGNNLRIPGVHSAPVAAPTPTLAASESTTYTVRRGDTLSEIATKHGVNIKDLQAWNNMGNSTRLQSGQTLRLKASDVPTQTASPVSTPSAPAEYHVVKANEYPQQIAKNYGISLGSFLAWNKMSASSKIYVGQRVVVGTEGATAAASAATPTPDRKIVHAVQRGDTAGGIAEKYGVGLSQLLAWNKLSSRSTLHIGDQLVVHLPQDAVAASSETSGQKKIHVVQRGQNPTTIARAHGVKVDELLKWNNWTKSHVLRIGEKVVIYTD